MKLVVDYTLKNRRLETTGNTTQVGVNGTTSQGQYDAAGGALFEVQGKCRNCQVRVFVCVSFEKTRPVLRDDSL